jgi:hypothetical protein
MKKLLPIIALVALLGQGCPTPPRPTPPAMPPKSPPSVEAPAAKMGFGKLPPLLAYGALGTSEAMSGDARSALSSVAPQSPAMNAAYGQGDLAVTGNVVGGGTTGIRIAPAPDGQQVNVFYTVSTTLPEWGAEDQVFRVRRPDIATDVVRNIAVPAGLPNALAGQIDRVQSVNMSWMDREQFTWNFDPSYGHLNWWKQYDPRIAAGMEADVIPQDQPALDKARAIAAADAFLNAHGLGSIREQGGMVEDQPWMTATDLAMPCIMKDEVTAREAEAAGVSASGEATSLIYPSPCGWYPQEVTVFYGSTLEGRSVVDAGGWPFRLSSVQVSLSDYSVRGGNVQMSQGVDRSAYPLITREEAMARLEAGGRNPVYGWGTEDVNVTIETTELAWMRFDSWKDNRQESYYLPALAVRGTIDRNMQGQEPEPYYTVVSLVADEAFDLGDGGRPMPVEPLMMDAPAASGAPTPVAEPKR